jgi:ATP/maltotriose-dependent transcriptional regulator MalT/DNA-binding SARP family transcriptional activator
MSSPQVIRTKIVPPRRSKRELARPRVSDFLADALSHRLTLIQAGAGYGKSTALAALVDGDHPLIWYQVARQDSDPLVFLQHLNYATQIALPNLDGLPTSILAAWEGSRGPLPANDIVCQYINALSEGLQEPTLLVLDDVHLASHEDDIAHILDLLIRLAPTDFHVLLAARPKVQLPNLSRWEARGQVLTLDQSHLAFTSDEIEKLFAECYNYELSQDEAQKLYSVTEGWAISLQLIWQSLRSGAAASVDDALNRQTSSLGSLFDVLAKEVLSQHPQDVQDFLRISSTLRVLTAGACDALRESQDSMEMLSYLRRQEFFIVYLNDDSLRYQHIFRQFLQQLVPEAQLKEWHTRAADFYRADDDPESTVYHLLKAEDFSQAAEYLETYGRELLAQGRLNTLENYLQALPPGQFHNHPRLLSYLGDLDRLHSRYQESLAWYQQAETIWRQRGQLGDVGRALRGQARVYLDTVDPARAEELLQEALHLSDGFSNRESQARLLEMLAENKLNAGKPDEAEKLREEANRLRIEGPALSQLMFRVLLRTGRLEQARQELELRVESERLEPVMVPRAHRESLFLLSLIYAFQGKAQAAFDTAEEGTQRGIELDSPYMTAVGHMRQGHALMLLPGSNRYSKARQQFDQAIKISHELATPRLRVEALWGMSRAYGYQGELVKAQQAAVRGIEIASQAGDEWIASLVHLAFGASLTLSGRFETSPEWLLKAARGFQECSDKFGYTVSRLWLCTGWFLGGERQWLSQVMPEVLETCSRNGYDYLLTRPTLLGTPDERVLIPLLIFARNNNWHAEYIDHLLEIIGLAGISRHPGYQLRVKTLGTFQVARGEDLIPIHGWRREKTRQLFQLLLTFRQAPLDREQVFEHLWPGAEPQVAQRNFKVALNTLFNVLEPTRKPGSESAYILREGSVYGIRPGADIWLDADAFQAKLDQSSKLDLVQDAQALVMLENTVGLYGGEYLPDARYENWAAIERERLSVQFLHAADRLCELYLFNRRYEDVVDLYQQILTYDNCWERAYRHAMIAYSKLGDHGQMARTYQRCIQTLGEELEVAPSLETEQLFQQLKS